MIVAEAYQNRDKRGVLKDLWVDSKEEKRVNMVHQWYIVLCHGDFKDTERYHVELWVKIITEILDTA